MQTLDDSQLTVDTVLGLPRDEFIKLAQSLIIAIPHRPSEGVSTNLFANNAAWGCFGTQTEAFNDEFGGFIEIFRAKMAQNFLNYIADERHAHVDKIVMIDNDQSVDWSAPYRLAMWDLPVVSGVVCNKNPMRGTFACFTVKDEFGVPRFPSTRYTGKLPSKGLLKAYSVGTGLICIKKQVLMDIIASGDVPFQIDENTRRESIKSGVLKHGEDIAFCRQANRAGHEIYVDLAVHATHHKRDDVRWPAQLLDDAQTPDSFKVDMRDYFHG